MKITVPGVKRIECLALGDIIVTKDNEVHLVIRDYDQYKVVLFNSASEAPYRTRLFSSETLEDLTSSFLAKEDTIYRGEDAQLILSGGAKK